MAGDGSLASLAAAPRRRRRAGEPAVLASGSTELFRIGLRAFYLESFVYGACMGVMLASVLVLFSNAAQVLDSDKVMALFGGVAPRWASCCR